MQLGVNLCFAVKRMLEPEAWAAYVRDELGLDLVQVTFDLIDPWWPDPERARIAARMASAAAAHGLTIHSACVGVAAYVPGGLLDPDPDARHLALTWWKRAVDLAAELGAEAVAGPLGSMSTAQSRDHTRREDRWQDLLESVTTLSAHTAEAGLDALLVEPTPISREIPSTIGQCHRLLDELNQRDVTNVALLLDTGHTVYEPLYGPHAAFSDWTSSLGQAIAAIHLDNSDRHGDPHWGWPHPHGTLDLEGVWADLAAAGLAEVPVMLEVFPRFEDDDDAVRAQLISTVEHCRLAAAAVRR